MSKMNKIVQGQICKMSKSPYMWPNNPSHIEENVNYVVLCANSSVNGKQRNVKALACKMRLHFSALDI